MIFQINFSIHTFIFRLHHKKIIIFFSSEKFSIHEKKSVIKILPTRHISHMLWHLNLKFCLHEAEKNVQADESLNGNKCTTQSPNNSSALSIHEIPSNVFLWIERIYATRKMFFFSPLIQEGKNSQRSIEVVWQQCRASTLNQIKFLFSPYKNPLLFCVVHFSLSFVRTFVLYSIESQFSSHHIKFSLIRNDIREIQIRIEFGFFVHLSFHL